MTEITEIEYVAKTAGLEAALARLEKLNRDVTEEEMALAKALRDGEQAAANKAKTLTTTNASMRAAEMSAKAASASFERTGSALMKVAGGASIASPALGEVFRNLGDLADIGEVATAGSATLAAGLGALAVVALELGAAYYVLTGNEREAARVSAELTIARKAMEPITRSLRDATIDLDEATGKLTATQADNLRASIAAHTQLQEATEGTRKRLGEIATEQGSIWTQMVDGVESVVPSWTPLGYAIRAVTTDSEDLRNEQAALNVVLGDAQAQTRALVTTEHARAEALAKTGAAAREVAVAQMSVEDQVLELRERVAQREADRQRAIRDKNNEDLLDKLKRDQKSEEDTTALVARESAKRIEIAQREAEAKVRAQQASEDAVVDILGSTANAMSTISQRIGKDNEQAALAAFYVGQASAAAQAAVNTVLAASRAMAEVPYPANIAVAAAAGAAGVAQEIAILSTPAPTFNDTPGVQQMPMGGQANFGPGDYFAAARDPEDLKRQVERVAPSSPSGPTVFMIGPNVLGNQLRDATTVQHSQLRATAGVRPTGQVRSR